MPADYWYNPKGTWGFWCKLMPSKIRERQPSQYEEIRKSMGSIPDHEWDSYAPTCGARFVPWAKGASKVVELKVKDTFYAILADRLPEELDDEIKKVQHAWHVALGRTTAEQIASAIPMCLPQTNKCTSCRVPGISKFDFAQWERDGCPTLTRSGWCALCKVIAMNKEVDLEGIIRLCDRIAIEETQNPSLQQALQLSRGLKSTKSIHYVSVDDDFVDC